MTSNNPSLKKANEARRNGTSYPSSVPSHLQNVEFRNMDRSEDE